MADENQPLPPKGALSFDFNQAVVAARRDYPEETKNITFIDAAKPGASKHLAEWIERATPAFQELLLGAFEVSPESIAIFAGVMSITGKSGYSLKDPFTSEKALFIAGDTKEQFLKTLPPEVAAFTGFNHELGHLILKEGLHGTLEEMKKVLRSDEHEQKLLVQKIEIVADVFTVMRGLQTGYISKQEVEQLVSFRAGANDVSHDTSKALRAVLEAHKDTDFTALTSQEIKTEAAKHAQKFTL